MRNSEKETYPAPKSFNQSQIKIKRQNDQPTRILRLKKNQFKKKLG